MKPWLKWTFALTVFASAVSLLWPSDSSSDGEREVSTSAASLPRGDSTSAQRSYDLPSALAEQSLEKTDKDPFATAPPPKPVPLPTAAVAPPPPEPPKAPPMTYRYLGSFTGPDGAREVYLTKGDRSLTVREGSQLEGGFAVTAISATAVHVLHSASMTKVDIPIAQKKDLP